jgi:DNA repair protein RadC
MHNTITVKELPEELRPYERCEKYGPGVLSDAELLAVVIRSGTVNEKSYDLVARILKSNDNAGLLNLHCMSMSELMEFKGIGRVKAVQLKCVAELTKRMARATRNVGDSFTTPEEVAAYYMEDMRSLDREQLIVVMLDGRSRRLNEVVMSIGSVNSSFASVRDIFYQALKNAAVRIIVIHNHPSGDPTPSREDMCVTEKIKEAGDLIGIPMVDHIIIGDNCYYSMKENGYI